MKIPPGRLVILQDISVYFKKNIIMASNVSRMSYECQKKGVCMIWSTRLELIPSTKQIAHFEIMLV